MEGWTAKLVCIFHRTFSSIVRFHRGRTSQVSQEENIVTMLKDLSDKIDKLTKALTGHWKDEAARRRERCW